jgi:hypothetical protein
VIRGTVDEGTADDDGELGLALPLDRHVVDDDSGVVGEAHHGGV